MCDSDDAVDGIVAKTLTALSRLCRLIELSCGCCKVSVHDFHKATDIYWNSPKLLLLCALFVFFFKTPWLNYCNYMNYTHHFQLT